MTGGTLYLKPKSGSMLVMDRSCSFVDLSRNRTETEAERYMELQLHFMRRDDSDRSANVIVALSLQALI